MKFFLLSLSFLFSHQLYSQLPKGLILTQNEKIVTQKIPQSRSYKMSKATARNFKEFQKINNPLLLNNNQKISYNNKVQTFKKDNLNQRNYSKSDASYWEKNTFEGIDWVNFELSATLMTQPQFHSSDSENPSANEQWNKIANAILPIDHEVLDIEMVDDNTIWMTSSSPPNLPDFTTNIYKSLDGGTNWELLNIPSLPNHAAVDISPINATTAYVVMVDFNESALDGQINDGIFKTIDGGASWTKIEGYSYNPLYIHFFNENEGWIIGEDNDDLFEVENLIMSITKDGGATWSHAGGEDWTIPESRSLPEFDSTELVVSFGNSYTGAYDIAENTILLGTNKRYWISADKGANWNAFDSPLFVNDNRNTLLVALKDEQTFMLASNEVGEEGFWQAPKAYTTTDGGQTWVASDPPVHTSTLHYLPNTENTFLIAGHFQFNESSGIAGTARTDDLKNWTYVDDKPILTMDFADEQGISTFGNIPSIGITGDVFNWGEFRLPDFDASVFRTNQNKYTQVTLNHLEEPMVLNYGIESIGLNDLKNTIFKLEVKKDGEVVLTEEQTIETVDTSSAGEISFIYFPDEIGFYEFNIAVSQSDIGQSFFQDVQILNVNETTLQKDDGTPEVGLSIAGNSPSHYGYFGSEFKLLTKDELRAITLLVIPDETASFQLLIKAVDEDGNIQAGEIFKSAPIPGTDVPETFVYTYVFDEPLTLEAGSYVFAAGEDERDGAFTYGFDSDRFDERIWSYSPIDSSEWIGGFAPLTMMIRPHFGDFMITSTAEDFLAETTPLKIFPQPFKEALYIQLDYPVEPTSRLQLFDATGKLWADREINHHQLIRQDFKALPKGLYFLRLSSGQYLRTVKVMKQ